MYKWIVDAAKPRTVTERGIRDSVNPKMLRNLGFRETTKLWKLMVVRMLRIPAC